MLIFAVYNVMWKGCDIVFFDICLCQVIIHGAESNAHFTMDLIQCLVRFTREIQSKTTKE